MTRLLTTLFALLTLGTAGSGCLVHEVGPHRHAHVHAVAVTPAPVVVVHERHRCRRGHYWDGHHCRHHGRARGHYKH
ncbi:MAG: hypothetical protein KC635_26675 [Myxococcales bacterium]|nr:hypothetical protein [Myxococcales bacterium]MCB9734987.1 hypothetical protein [Deltaproteobacteria bacterium]MCB9737627.1 hypothetical protein [Deltaproteobacteria bacterium]